VVDLYAPRLHRLRAKIVAVQHRFEPESPKDPAPCSKPSAPPRASPLAEKVARLSGKPVILFKFERGEKVWANGLS
jgi:hypothetical protein